jgi:N-acetylglucosaminyl-diphospho-decaprenol L-rhamnosyltransferase
MTVSANSIGNNEAPQMPETLQPTKFSVIIVNYNGGHFIQGALDSLARQGFRDFEVILLDNNSSDGSADGLRTNGLPAFRLMKQDTNLGFAAGNNLAAADANGEWLALLNPDAVAEPDWLEQILAGMDRHPAIRHFACTQFDLARPEYLDGVGDAYLVFGMPWRGGFGLPASFLPGEGTCFSPCGASAIIRRDVFQEHNGFDERFFCYCEDVDLGYRMQLAGHKCVFLPSAVVRHAGSAVSGRHSDFSIYHGTRNRIWTYAKCTPVALVVLTLPVHLALSLYVLLRSPAIHRFSITLDGMRDGLAGVFRMRAPSPWVAPRRKVGLLDLARQMAWNPFRMSRRRPHVRPLGPVKEGPCGRSS